MMSNSSGTVPLVLRCTRGWSVECTRSIVLMTRFRLDSLVMRTSSKLCSNVNVPQKCVPAFLSEKLCVIVPSIDSITMSPLSSSL